MRDVVDGYEVILERLVEDRGKRFGEGNGRVGMLGGVFLFWG